MLLLACLVTLKQAHVEEIQQAVYTNPIMFKP